MPCKPDNSRNLTCNKTKQELIDYLGPSNLILYYNAPRFDEQKFDGTHIIKESVIHNMQFDNFKPNFFTGKIMLSELEDEVSWIHLGIPSVDTFTYTSFGE